MMVMNSQLIININVDEDILISVIGCSELLILLYLTIAMVNWVTEPDAYLEPKLTPSGFGIIIIINLYCPENILTAIITITTNTNANTNTIGARPPKTVMEVFRSTKEKFGSRNAMALKRPVNGVVPSAWTFWTWYT